MRLLRNGVVHRWPAPPVRADVLIDTHIRRISPSIAPQHGWEVVDLDGRHLAPGFIDVQINGGFGHDLTSDPSAIPVLAAHLPAHGVTAFLPTIITSPADSVAAAREVIDGLRPDAVGRAAALGLHLEGPFLAPERIGAHESTHLRQPDASLTRWWSRASGIRLVTLAPELPGSLAVVRELVARGVTVSAGHSSASYRELGDAVDYGVRAVTHLFNAMGPFHHREPGIIGRAFTDDRLAASIIVDGHHVHPAAVRTAWTMLGPGRLILITDAIAGLGMGDGSFVLAGAPVQVSAGVARTADGVLAGSVLSMDVAVRNLIATTGCSPSEAFASASTTPARLIGEADRGVIAEDMRADLIVLDGDLSVRMTIIGGEMAFATEPTAPR